jgi:hypothetical protein
MRTVLLAALVILAGCASSSPSSDSTEAAAPLAAQATAETASTASSETAAEPADAGASEPFRAPAGYKARVENGQTVYCRKVTVLGSRFPQNVCMTEAQLREHLHSTDTMKRDKDQSSRMCVGDICGGT